MKKITSSKLSYALLIGILTFPLLIKASPQESAQEQDLQKNSRQLDVVVLFDDGSDARQAKTSQDLGAIGVDLQQSIQQMVPFITSSIILPTLKQYSPENYKKILSDNWVLFSGFDNGYDFIVGLPKNYWPGLDVTNLNNLLYIGLNKAHFTQLKEEALEKIIQSFEQNPQYPDGLDYPVSLSKFKLLFANNTYVKKNIFVSGHGAKGFVVNLNLETYKELLEFLNLPSTNLLYVNSCYAGGVNLIEAYQKQNINFVRPLTLNYFIFIGGVTDTVTYATATNFKSFFETIHQFFSPAGPQMAQPLKAIAAAVASEKTANIPLVRFPGNINYFKAIEVDNKIAIITHAKATAAQLGALDTKIPQEIQNALDRITQARIATKKPAKTDIQQVEEYLKKKRDVNVAKADTITITNKEVILVYPAVITAPIVVNDPGTLKTSIISMIPGDAIHYFESIDYRAPDLMYFVFSFLNIAIENSLKLFFVNNVLHKNKMINHLAVFMDDSAKKVTALYKENSKYTQITYAIQPDKYAQDAFNKTGEQKINEQDAYTIIRQAIKKFGSWQPPIGHQRPQDLIDKSLSITPQPVVALTKADKMKKMQEELEALSKSIEELEYA